ncbi:DNA primase [Ectocarpus siliculosus]|uniref:DNA primase n=1 Tax=Ectocarpus siliculosus TaxID=2880 RepID=D7G3B8_ECTSI|nr:DNA primase [Ectocarpus siliculosus]|eukprot:CBJ33512.1 DNA primase [Ectocarpus siliculosus]
MRSAPEARTGVRRSLRLATAAAAAAAATTSLVATTTTPKAAEAFLCGPPPRTAAAGSSRRLLHRAQQQQQQPRSSSWCALPTSSSGFGTSAASSGQECTGRRRRRLPPSRPRAVAPLSAAAAGNDRPGDAAPAAGGGRGPQQSRLPQRVELAAGQPRGSVQQRKEGGGGGGGGRKPFGPSRHITDETLDLIRASTSITEVIGQHVEMKPAGRGMVGCCPFHEDRTPSFSVDDSRGSYHCFGCGASGDVITFLMQIDGLGFREVVHDLAVEAGIPLGFENAADGSGGGKWDTADEKARREARERLSLVLQMAAQFYTRCLVEMPAAGGARAHIIERGISPMTVMDFQLGYSPADLTSPLIEYLDQEGFEMDTLVDAGLVPDTSKWKYRPSPNDARGRVDRFRGRLVVPIRDHRGLVIGFGARDLSDSQAQGSVGSGFVIPDVSKKGKAKKKGEQTEAAAAATGDSSKAALAAGGKGVGEGADAGKWEKKARPPAKYLNSPETTLFKKGKNVFGLDLAKEAMRSEDTAFVVEGYFDVIKLHDAGIRCAVGVLGTAITIDQLQLCARYTKSKRVILCMDGDAAGRRAVERLCESPASSGLDSLSEAGVSVSVATIPEDPGCKDPADFLQAHGAEEFRAKVMGKAVPWSDWYGDSILADHDFAGDANAFRRCTDRLTGFMSDLSIPTDQTFHVHRFAKALAGGNEAMRHQLEFDLMNMSNEKRARKNALRRRSGHYTGSWNAGVNAGSAPPAQGMKKREESRLKREKYGSKRMTIWSPSMEQEYGGGSEESKATELALRGRILDQAQRFLLALVVHDPSRRAKCLEEVSRHGLYLGGERRQWLFNALTASVSPDPALPSAAGAGGGGGDGQDGAGRDSPPAWGGPTPEALEAGGDVLFAEVRAAAPGGYFALRGKAAGKGGGGVGADDEGEKEDTLDWVFERAEAERVAKGANTDLVLLEVVMVMLKEQAAAKMHSLSLELADTSNAIARTMAEAATADFLALDPPQASGEPPETATAPESPGVAAGKGQGVGRSRAEAQAEVERLKVRQSELFEMIQEQREEVTEFEARRKAFTNRLPKVRAETEAIRKQEARAKRQSMAAAAPAARSAAPSPRPPPPTSPPPPPPPQERSQSPADTRYDERRQQQLQQLRREAGGEDEGELSVEDLPYRFLDEDKEPEEGINIYDVDGNIAAAMAAMEAAEASKGARSERNARRGAGTPQAVTVMGGGGGDGGLDDAVVERMAREAEEQMEQMNEDDGVFDGSETGW